MDKTGMEYKIGETLMLMECMERLVQFHQGPTTHIFCKWKTKLEASTTSHPLHFIRQLVGSEASESLVVLEFQFHLLTPQEITLSSSEIGTKLITRWVLVKNKKKQNSFANNNMNLIWFYKIWMCFTCLTWTWHNSNY